MKKLNKKIQILGAVAMAAGFASQAKADVDYTFSDYSLETVNVTLNGNNETVFAGGLQVTEVGGPVAGAPSSFVTVCTDFSAVIGGGTYQYALPVSTSPAPAGYTGDPAWATQPYALQNASTLFALYQGALTGGNLDAAAGLQLAVWTALYDSTALGAFGGTTFQLNGTGGAYADALADLNSLAGLTTPIATDIILPDPDNGSNGNGGLTQPPPQGLLYSSVPEASTVLSGSLLLLSFGVCSFKSFGKARA